MNETLFTDYVSAYVKFDKELNSFASISKILITDPISVLNPNILALIDLFDDE